MPEPRNCIFRLFRYRRCLRDLKDLGYVKVFSDNLGSASGVTAAQVRKDFSLFGITGNKKGGYIIEVLLEKMNRILGKDEVQKVILVGTGNLGSALLKYKGFEKEDISLVAAFDADPAKHGRIGNIPVYPVRDILDFVKQNRIKVAVLAVPAAVAQESAEMLIASGIRGLLNFTPVTLKVQNVIVVNNINLAIELENAIYYVNALEKKQKDLVLDQDGVKKV